MGRLFVFLLAVAVCATPQSADKLRGEARKAEKSGDSLRAYLLYSQAAGLDPKDAGSWPKALALQGRALEAAAAARKPDSAEPNEHRIPDLADIAAARYMGPPIRLWPALGVRSFDLKGDSKTVCQQVLQAYGIDAVFDADLQPLPNIRFRLADVEFAEAADALSLATGTFLVPAGHKMAVVARDTPNKRQELEHTMAIAVPLPTTITVQEAQELARAVQSIMEIQKFGVDPNQRLAVIRDRESKVLPALALFDDLLRHRAQVTVEVELFEANETADLTVGLQFPTEYPLIALSRVFNTNPIYPAGIANFVTFGGGASFLGLGLASSHLFANFAKSNGRSLKKAEIRGVEGQAMNFHLGDRYPVMTGGYFGDTGGATGTVYRPPPTFNFEDLGVVLKLTPHVHGPDEMTLEIEADYKVLTGQALNGIPVIASRSFKTSARIGAGETAVIAGLMRASEARTLTGLAGLSNLPALGHLFRQEIRNKDSAQALLVIRPHIIDLPPSTLATRSVLTGTDSKPKIPL